MQDTTPVLQLTAVTRRWRAGILGVASEVTALTECSLTLFSGEIVAVTGGAGAGKTTLLLLATGRATPTTGSIRWCDSSDPAESGAQLVGARPWEYGFLTVRQALAFHADLLAMRNAALPAPTRFVPLMRRVGLRGMGRVRLGQLSALDKLRVVIAQSLLATPRLLCCDEPFAHCGPAEREAGANVLRELARGGVAVLIATRDEAALRSLALVDQNRIHHLDAGRLREPQPPRQSVLELAVSRPEEAISRLLPRLPTLARRGRRLRVPLGGTSPEAVLALCRDVGVTVRGSRVAEEALPHAPAPR